MKTTWKAQRPQKLTKICRVVTCLVSHCILLLLNLFQIEEEWPILKKFRNSWATTYLVKEVFTSNVTYRSALAKENSYRNRRRQQLLTRAHRHNQTQDSDSDVNTQADVDMEHGDGPMDQFEDGDNSDGDGDETIEDDEDMYNPDMLED